jgi:transcriptional regulator with XRE-family HTH domain
MSESLGARLRQRRETQQISLTTIAEQTKIKLSLLEALERDDVSHWPAGIFRRAFIRAYAHAIGLEPDVVVREFLEQYPDPIEVVAPESVESVNEASVDGAAPPNAGPPTRFGYLMGTAVEGLSRYGRRLLHAGKSAVEDLGVADRISVKAQAPFQPDLLAAAHLCTEFSRIVETSEAAPLLQEAARILDAVGLIVWVWDATATELTPTLAHGYSDRLLAQLPRVRRDTNNATAAAFRSAQMSVVSGSDLANGALAVPLMSPLGCVGVLAVELQHSSAQSESVRALVTIFAAQLARLVEASRPTEAAGLKLA